MQTNKEEQQLRNSEELNARIESIEELLRSRGFFDTPELEDREVEVLAA